MADLKNNGNQNKDKPGGAQENGASKTPATAKSAEVKSKKDKPKFREKIEKGWRNFKSELKKIVWSPWKDVKRNTILVIGCVVVISAFIGILDFAFSNGLMALGKLV